MNEYKPITNAVGVISIMYVPPYLWYQADMDVAEVLPLHLELELSEGLDEGHALDVAHCASQLLTQNISLGRRAMNTQVSFSAAHVRQQRTVKC